MTHSVEKDRGRGWLREWGESHPEGGEQLAYRCTGYDREPFWEFSVWLDWTHWGLGFDAGREYGGRSWPDYLRATVSLGPLTLAAVRTWNDPARTRVTSPGSGDTE
jgi:hypothetical protein